MELNTIDIQGKHINEKLFNLQQEIGGISKLESNPFYNSKYFDINSLIKQLNPLLLKHKLLLLQPIEDNKVVTKIICVESNSDVSSFLTIPAVSDPQKLGGAITYLRRYTLASLLGLQAEDDDANSASGLKKNKQTKVIPMSGVDRQTSDKGLLNKPKWIDAHFDKTVKKLQDGETTIELIQKAVVVPTDVLNKLKKIEILIN